MTIGLRCTKAVLSVGFLKVKQKVNKKNQEKLAQARFHCLFAFKWIPNTKTFNTQLSQKEVGEYPIASNPYLELWSPVHYFS